MIEAVLFDFGQTLVDSADGFRSAEKMAKERIFLDIFPYANDGQWEVFLTEYRQIRKKFHAESNFSRPAIWKTVYGRFHCEVQSRALETLETEYWDLVKSRTRPFPETIPVLRELFGKFQLGIVTNTQGQKSSGTHRITLFPEIEKYFTAIVVAGESGIPPKPHAGAFAACLEQMEIEPSRALYVGDDFHKDICGADYAGLHPVWLKHRLVKRSWPETEPGSRYRVITDLNQLLQIPVGRSDA